MGDRCYMSVTCRRQDKDQFEALGFRLEFEQSADTPIIEMVDDEANYAHYEALPRKIPFLAWHGAGCNYGDGKIACDGAAYAEVGANNDGFVVRWDRKTNQPTPQSILAVQHYLAIKERIKMLFTSLAKSATPNPNPQPIK